MADQLDHVNFSMEIPDSKRLRVVFVTTTYPSADHPQRNIFTHRSIKALASEIDMKVIEFCSWKRGRPFISTREYDGIRVISFACPKIRLQKAAYINVLIQAYFGKHLLRSCLRSADVIHAASLYPPGFIAGQWAKSVRKPCTAHAIGSDVNFLLPQVRKSLLFHRPWHIDGIVCNSNDMMKKVMSLFPEHQNIRVIYRGVDADKYSPLRGDFSGKEHGSPLRFLFLGGFHTWNADHPFYNLKGGHLLLQAWQLIEHQIAPDVLIVGGPNTDVYEKQLEQWRSSLSRPDSVRFLAVVNPDAVPQMMRDADVVVIPSLFEGLPNLAKEAQACGCPVLGTDAGGIPEAVLHNKTGIIVPRGDNDALAGALLWFHANRSAIPTMGMDARAYVRQKFSWDHFSKEMIDFFHQAIQARAARS